jgi:hypothetical protein
MAAAKEVVRDAIAQFGDKKVDQMLAWAIKKGANILPQVLYDHTRFPASGPVMTTFFKTGASAFTASTTKTPTDTNLNQDSKLNTDESYIGIGFFKSYPQRWVAYNATPANQMNDFLNRTKDIEQLESVMSARMTVKYQGSFEFCKVPVYQIPGGNQPSTWNQVMSNPSNWYPFDRIAAFELDSNSSFNVVEEFDASAPFGSDLELIQGVFIVGLMIKGLGNLSAEWRKMVDDYNKNLT